MTFSALPCSRRSRTCRCSGRPRRGRAGRSSATRAQLVPMPSLVTFWPVLPSVTVGDRRLRRGRPARSRPRPPAPGRGGRLEESSTAAAARTFHHPTSRFDSRPFHPGRRRDGRIPFECPSFDSGHPGLAHQLIIPTPFTTGARPLSSRRSRPSGRSRGSPGVASLADLLEGPPDGLVVGVAVDVDEEEVGGVEDGGGSATGNDSILVRFTPVFSKGATPARVPALLERRRTGWSCPCRSPLGVLGDDGEAGDVVGLVLDVLGQDVQAIASAAGRLATAAANLALGHLGGGGRRDDTTTVPAGGSCRASGGTARVPAPWNRPAGPGPTRICQAGNGGPGAGPRRGS